MNLWEIADILDHVKYLDFEFHVQVERTGFVMYIEREEIDHTSGEPKRFKGRQFFVPANMTKDDLVRTCLVAVLAWQEHEVREAFSYCDAAIFDPHFSVDELAERARTYTHKE